MESKAAEGPSARGMRFSSFQNRHNNYWLCGEITLVISEVWALAQGSAPVPQPTHCFCFSTWISPPWGFLFLSSQRLIALKSLCRVWDRHKCTNLNRISEKLQEAITKLRKVVTTYRNNLPLHRWLVLCLSQTHRNHTHRKKMKQETVQDGYKRLLWVLDTS